MVLAAVLVATALVARRLRLLGTLVVAGGVAWLVSVALGELIDLPDALVDAGIARGKALLTADSAFRGENWQLDGTQLGGPGTAMRGTPRSSASEAVISEPPRSRDSTTTTTSERAATMRLRRGNR